VLGAGPVGSRLEAALRRHGEDVAIVSRKRPVDLPAEARHLAVDALDEPALSRACAGSAVVYQCLNAPYHRWPEVFPPLQRAAIAAARSAGARLVSFENVYMYGRPGGGPFTEQHPNAPCSSKGRVRAAMVDELAGLVARGELAVTHVRASDLFGPGMRRSALGDEVIGRAVAGKGARGFGDLTAPHTWTFTHDAGETLARAGLRPGGTGEVWHVPSEAPRSQVRVAAELSEMLGRQVELKATPTWLLKALGVFVPEVGALVEMAYEFEGPFVVGDGATRAALQQASTPFTDALLETVNGFERAAGGSRRPA